MAHAQGASDAAIREQAYYLWEQDGRPEGHDMEYWSRATVAVTEKSQLDTLTKPAPKKAAKPKAAAAEAAASPKLKAAATKVKAAPVKSAKADPKAKPKKK